MANVFIILTIVGICCAVTRANVPGSTAGSHESNETNPTISVPHVSVDNDTEDVNPSSSDDADNSTMMPPVTNKINLSTTISTLPPIVHGHSGPERNEAAHLNATTPNTNSVEHTAAKENNIRPSSTTSTHPPMVHGIRETSAGKSETSTPKPGKGHHNGVKGLSSSLVTVFICLAFFV